MITNTNGIGSKKHGKSGFCSKSPKMKHHMKRIAEQNEIKAKPTNCKYNVLITREMMVQLTSRPTI